ncbi:MAG: DUF4097 domain-containing protein [Clostridium sp.]|nr:DUF4097 domain-containing protein [Clostridium sp.]
MKSKKLIPICVVFIIIGIGLSLLGYRMGGSFSFSFSPDAKLLTDEDIEKATKLTTEKTSPFTDMDIHSETMDVEVKTGDEYSISYPESPYDETVYSVENNVLTVDSITKNHVFFFSFDTAPQKKTITITVPKQLSAMSLQSENGDCRIEGQTAEKATLIMDYGDLYIQDCDMENASITSKDGDVSCKNCRIDRLDAALAYGNCTIADSVITDHSVTLKDGDAVISNLRAQKSDFDLTYGDITMTDSRPRQLSVQISDGDCKITLPEDKDKYSLLLNNADGDTILDGSKFEGTYQSEGTGKYTVSVTSKYGDIHILFDR